MLVRLESRQPHDPPASAVSLEAEEVRQFYLGFSNEVIWPLFHDLPSLCNFDPAYWRAYQQVNRRFAKAAAASAGSGDFIWVHDYHLMGMAAELRKRATAARVGFFLHIPFPSPDIFSKLPWRKSVLEALLHFDLVGFQTRRDRANFLACVQALMPQAQVDSRGALATVRSAAGKSRVGAFPISIDYNAFLRASATPASSRSPRSARVRSHAPPPPMSAPDAMAASA